MITKYFIIGITTIIVIYDIWALVKKKGTITSWFRRWFEIGKDNKGKGLPVVPYAFGTIFLGHIPLWIDFSFINKYVCLAIFVILSLSAIIITIKCELDLKNDPDDCSKVYLFFKDKWYLNMLFGAVIGCLWWL